MGAWKSLESLGPFKYESNFENWVNARACPGYFQFIAHYDQAQDNYQAEVHIPVVYYADFVRDPKKSKELEPKEGYFKIYQGRLEVSNGRILIWQNEKVPVEIKYTLKNDLLTLKLFTKNIIFSRIETQHIEKS